MQIYYKERKWIQVKVTNKKKFIVRTIEIIIVLATIILTVWAIKYANQVRGYKGFGGELLLPIISLMIILILEEYLESEEKNEKKNKKR